ncbi:MAG: hypothetical protein RL654_3380 [Pseudomonadota bacterium]|jgi:hypothetical protein
MHSPFVCKSCWQRLALRIRCALTPDEPRLLAQHLAAAQSLVLRGHLSAREAATRCLGLLLDTAADPLLPQHWRQACLDHAARPLAQLAALAVTAAQHEELAAWRWRLAHLDVGTTLPLTDNTPPC